MKSIAEALEVAPVLVPTEAPVVPVIPEAIIQDPAPPVVLPLVVHLGTKIESIFGIADKDGNVHHPTPLTMELDKLNAATLTEALVKIREERHKFAQMAAEAGIG